MPETKLQFVLFCPLCCSPIDAEKEEGKQEFECISCEQTFEMEIDPDRQAAHSIV